MIKLPARICIYPQSRRNPAYLLCWIPRNDYDRLLQAGAGRAGELIAGYPDGIELELSEAAFQEWGLNLPAPIEQIRGAYLFQFKARSLDESGLVELDVLLSMGEREIPRRRGKSGRALGTLSGGDEETPAAPAAGRKPEMVGDEDAVDLFRRLSGRKS
jgi:hypothetical protein